MRRAPLSLDTSPHIERMQIDAWRRMTDADKAAIVTNLTRAALDMAKCGIRDRFPEASPDEQRLRLALILLGRELAEKAFPDITTLDPQ